MIIKTPATSANLGPGFDSLGVALGLYNIVEVKRSKFFSVSIKGEGSKLMRIKNNNLFVNIFNDHYKQLNNQEDIFRFEFHNSIPISRGLGSSSATIVSAIAAAYEISKVSITKDKILNYALAYEPHPDNITPAIMGGYCVAALEDHRVVYANKEMPNDIKAVIVIPNQHMSTSRSRGTLPKKYSKEDSVFNLSRAALQVALIFSGKYEELRVASKDKFHQEIRMKSLPPLFEVQKAALNNGALMSTLSGSGSSFFNLVHESDAANLARVFEQNFPQFKTLVLDFDNCGLTSLANKA